MTDKLRQAAQQALEALETGWSPIFTGKDARALGASAITTLREALAEPAEHVADGGKSRIRAEIAAEVATQPAAQVEYLARWLCKRDRIDPDLVLDSDPDVKLAWHREDLNAARLLSELKALEPAEVQEPVHGDVLPPVGCRVFIRHARDDDAHACTVIGYYAWGDLGGAKHLHRVFVRMVYEGATTQQARMLCDCYPTAEAALAANTPPSPQQAAEAQEPDPADIIAGALQTSRGHAIELMRAALAAQKEASDAPRNQQ